MYQFTLYIAGQTPSSKAAVSAVRGLLERTSSLHALDVVDVVRNPEAAAAASVFATPTMIKTAPRPCCKVVGDFRNMRTVFLKLGVNWTDFQSSSGQESA